GRRRCEGRVPPRPRRSGLARQTGPRRAVPAGGRPSAPQSRLAALRARHRGGVILGAFAVDWYAARAAGVVAYLLVSASVALGLALAGKQRLERWPRFAVQ